MFQSVRIACYYFVRSIMKRDEIFFFSSSSFIFSKEMNKLESLDSEDEEARDSWQSPTRTKRSNGQQRRLYTLAVERDIFMEWHRFRGVEGWISSGSGYDGPLVGRGNWKTLVIGYGSLDGFYEVDASNRCIESAIVSTIKLTTSRRSILWLAHVLRGHVSNVSRANFVRIRGRLPRRNSLVICLTD